MLRHKPYRYLVRVGDHSGPVDEFLAHDFQAASDYFHFMLPIASRHGYRITIEDLYSDIIIDRKD